MVRTLPHGTTQFLSFFLLPASIFAEGINLSSFNAFQFLKIIKISITSSKSSKKLCHTTNPPTALPVGVSRVRPPQSGITPLTCTIFDPVLQPRFIPIFGVLDASALRVFCYFLQIGSYRAEYSLIGHFIQFCRITAHVATRRLTRRCLCRFLSIVLSLS